MVWIYLGIFKCYVYFIDDYSTYYRKHVNHANYYRDTILLGNTFFTQMRRMDMTLVITILPVFVYIYADVSWINCLLMSALASKVINKY